MSNIFDTFTVLKPDQQMDQLTVGPDFYQSLDADYDGFKGHTLVSAHQFSASWGVWEKHPEGDEMVILLTGRAEMKMKSATGEESKVLERPGAFVVIPKGIWHTAIIDEPTTMLFVTPGEGTLNEESPDID